MGTSLKPQVLSSHPKSTTRVIVKSTQHQQDLKLPLPISLYKLVRKYFEIPLIEVYYRGYLKLGAKSFLKLQVDDKRLVSDKAKKQLRLTIPADAEAHLVIRGLPAAPVSGGSPWVITVKTEVANVTFGTRLGELVIRPHFVYTNFFTPGSPLEVEKREGDRLLLSSDPDDTSGKGILLCHSDKGTK